MGFIHEVKQGEHLAGIAAKFGFRRFLTIWNHPENAALKELRKNPNILFPGDRLFIPDRTPKEEAVPTDRLNRFVAAVDRLVLRIKVLEQNDKPIHGDCSLVVGSSATQMPQKGDIFEGAIDTSVEVAELDFPISPAEKLRPKIALSVGHLDPVDTLHGQQQRLNNLGYFAGFHPLEKPNDQFKWAVEEFQCDHPPLVVDGKLGPQSRQQLEIAYGS